MLCTTSTPATSSGLLVDPTVQGNSKNGTNVCVQTPYSIQGRPEAADGRLYEKAANDLSERLKNQAIENGVTMTTTTTTGSWVSRRASPGQRLLKQGPSANDA